LFKNAVSKNLDWPEVVWEAWISFEEFYGNVETLETAKTRVGHLQESRAKRQAKVRRSGRVTGVLDTDDAFSPR
jgi:hypothetical protein